MTSVVVNDASCLIDLHKGHLLDVFCNLPYHFVIPLTVREIEVLSLSKVQWKALDDSGMITHDLAPNEVGQALALKQRYPGLSANDCICHVTAMNKSAILLTGDALLRKVATQNGLRVHGVLWIIDELEAHGTCEKERLILALQSWQTDVAVFLPDHEITKRLAHLQSH